MQVCKGICGIDAPFLVYAALVPIIAIRYKKARLFLFLAGKSYNFRGIEPLFMLSPGQVTKLISSNEALQAQLGELNEILSIREEEIALLKKKLAGSTELRSQFDRQQEELEAMEMLLGKRKQQALGAEEREIELHKELTVAVSKEQAYEALKTNNRYLQTRFNDIEYELSEYKAGYRELEAKARRVAEMESLLEDALQQNDRLKSRLQELEMDVKGLVKKT